MHILEHTSHIFLISTNIWKNKRCGKKPWKQTVLKLFTTQLGHWQVAKLMGSKARFCFPTFHVGCSWNLIKDCISSNLEYDWNINTHKKMWSLQFVYALYYACWLLKSIADKGKLSEWEDTSEWTMVLTQVVPTAFLCKNFGPWSTVHMSSVPCRGKSNKRLFFFERTPWEEQEENCYSCVSD